MPTSPFPQSQGSFRYIRRIALLVTLAGLMSCGGVYVRRRTGGGGGGGNNGQPCVPQAPNTTPASVSKGVGQVVPSTFMDLHLGTTTIAWPTVSFGGLRLWDTNTGWAEINTGDGSYNWTTLDGYVSDALAHDVDLLYNLARTPTWASSKPNDNSCAYDSADQGGPGQCDAPNDLNADGTGSDAHWIKWVSAVAARYKGRIKYYEIWNEFNTNGIWSPNNTLQQLVRMEQDARCVVEGPPQGLTCNPNSTFPFGTALDPAARITTPSPVGAHIALNTVSQKLDTYFNTQVGSYKGGQFADIIAFHGYVGTTPGSGICPIPEDVNTVIDQLNTTVNNDGQAGKPWFNTEGGWSMAPDEGFLDQQRQAAFLGRYFLLQDSLGVNRMYWYRWDAPDPSTGALWSISSGATPAATAYGEISKWIVGATLSTACTPNGTIWSCSFTRTNGYKALAVWDASQDCTSSSCPTSAFTVPAVGYAMYRDLSGNETGITGSTVPLGGKAILLETGPLP